MVDSFIRDGLARQLVARNQSRVTVLIEEGKNEILAYYAINAHSVERKDMPPSFFAKRPEKQIPNSMALGAIFLSRLGVTKAHQSNGMGREMLMHALQRCLKISHQLGVFCVVLDALNMQAEKFYEKRGFLKCAIQLAPPRYYLAISVLKALDAEQEQVSAEMPLAALPVSPS